jgi:ABC-type phosphate transport system substrate-binding protein
MTLYAIAALAYASAHDEAEERMNLQRSLVAFAIAGACLAAATTAQAQTTCGGTMPNDAGANFTATPIYITGSTALEPMIKAFGPKLAQQTSPYVIIYLKDGSCAGVNRINSDGKIAAGTTMLYIPPDFNSTKSYSCNIAAGGQVGDLVLSDVDATLCPGISAQPANTKDYKGPVNNMVLIVPSTSTQTAISAEDAYLIFGMGAAGMVMPWSDPLYYIIRTSDSGTRAMINANIGVAAHAWQGADGTAGGGKANGSGDVFNKVAANAQTAAEKTIGTLGEDFLDQGTNRTSVKALAFRAFKQHYAYWPDSTVTSRDKRNVRDGRYAIWGNVHMLLQLTGTTPVSAVGKYFVDLIQGTLTPAPSFDATDTIVDGHLVPQCAMNVARDLEGGPQKPYSDPAPCGCYFENRATGTPPSSCTACTGSGQGTCASGMCRRGFCEAK